MDFTLPKLVGVVGRLGSTSTQTTLHLPFQRFVDRTLTRSEFPDSILLVKLFFLVEILEVFDLVLERVNFSVCLLFKSLKRLNLLIESFDDLCKLGQLLSALCQLLLREVEFLQQLLVLLVVAGDELFVHFDKVELILLQRLIASFHKVVALLTRDSCELHGSYLVGKLFFLGQDFFELAEEFLIASCMDLYLQLRDLLLQFFDSGLLLCVLVAQSS